MKKLLLIFICICLAISQIPNVWAQSSIAGFDPHLLNWFKFNPLTYLPYSLYVPQKNKPVILAKSPIILKNKIDPYLLNWVKSNISPITQLPYSFYIAPKDKAGVYARMESSGALQGSIERTITHEGMDIYDGAVYQMVLTMAGGQKNLKQASLADSYYWQGAVGDSWNIRAGYPINNFIYDPKNPEKVSSDLSRLGQRGFIFRILDADGQYLVTDPWNGKKTMAGFPENDQLHWLDWKPVAGENAWVVMAAMQLYTKHKDSIELNLAKELARAAMILQSDCGGIRMAPLGTNRTLSGEERKNFNENDWWYKHISTENNISWYGAFRMLYQITGEAQYKKAMDGIECYLKFVWDDKEGLFYQGASFINDHWVTGQGTFALNVQTWGIACIGPQQLDSWFGAGSAWRIWQTGRKHSGVFDQRGGLLGVGYTDEHDRISIEWSAGAMVALKELANYYKIRDPKSALQALGDKNSMRKSMEKFHYRISQSLAAYSYSSRRGEIPFGWNSHDPQVMSLASTGWMIFVDAGINPFRLL